MEEQQETNTHNPVQNGGNQKAPIQEGALSEKLAELKEEMNLSMKVLYIGFAGVFVAVLIAGTVFFLEKIHERNATYDQLLERVIVLETKINACYVPQ